MGSQSIRPRSLVPCDLSSGETSRTREMDCAQGESYRHATTIGMLPDGVLLDIFDFYRKKIHYSFGLVWEVWEWHLLVHVCRRWRQLIFGSPLRLNLQILCTSGTLIRRNLGIWPAFPIGLDYYSGITRDDEDNANSALEHPDRVFSVRLNATGSQLRKMATVMQKPFPVLTHLHITCDLDEPVPVLSAEFLGGSAPCLQELFLGGIPFPALPTLLLSTNALVKLVIRDIPPTGYIPPQEMVTCLAALPKLEVLEITFQSVTPRPDGIRPPPVTRTVLPALTHFVFDGDNEYLEDLVALLDSPRLIFAFIRYLNQLVEFRVPQLSQFINRSVGPELTPFRRADVLISASQVTFRFHRHANIFVYCKPIDWHVSHVAQVFSQFSATLSNVVHLKLEVNLGEDRRLEGTDDDWLHLFHRFSTVQSLCLSRTLAWAVALALEDIAAEMVAEVLPSLDLICLEGHPASSVEKFVASRRLSNRPVTVIDTAKEYESLIHVSEC